jgi:hypothetical protein
MKKIFVATVALAVLASFISSAQAITATASIKKAVAAVKGKAAAANSSISWEGVNVATANKKGAFKFSGVVPADCVGKLSDGVDTIDVAIANRTPTGAVLETRQTTCYNSAGIVVNCAGTGQDGELGRGRARSYAGDVNGLTITDNTTGLEWEKITNDSTIHDGDNVYTWAQAFQKIADLNTANFAGHSDWRLPNVNELQTLADYGRVGPALDPVFANGVDSFLQSTFYWSSTTFAGFPVSAWGVNFFSGLVVVNTKTLNNFVTGVRGGS